MTMKGPEIAFAVVVAFSLGAGIGGTLTRHVDDVQGVNLIRYPERGPLVYYAPHGIETFCCPGSCVWSASGVTAEERATWLKSECAAELQP